MKLRGLTSFLLLLVYTESLADDAAKPVNPANITIEEIFEHWRQRAESIHSFHFEWTTREWHARGSKTSAGGPGSNSSLQPDSKSLLPRQDVTFDVHTTLTDDGDRFHLERRGLEWVAPDEAFLPSIHIEQRDLRNAYTYLGMERSSLHNQATIRPNKDYLTARSLMALPVMLACRPLHERMGAIDASRDWTLRKDRAIIDRRECLILVDRKGETYSRDPLANQRETVIHVDPALGYAVVKYAIMRLAHSSVEIEMSYSSDSDGSWPTSWRTKYFNPQGEHDLLAQLDARITKVSFDHVPVIPEFEGALPPGTVVQDDLSGQQRTILEPLSAASQIRATIFYIAVALFAIFALLGAIRYARPRLSRAHVSPVSLPNQGEVP